MAFQSPMMTLISSDSPPNQLPRFRCQTPDLTLTPPKDIAIGINDPVGINNIRRKNLDE
jgi:hypothetical protein